MNLVIKILIAMIVFSLIVTIHELGHFLLAKKNNIGVTEFSIGMGPRIWSFDKGGTKYSLKALPIGGSCMMVGEDEEVDAKDAFNKQSVGARISVIIAGPAFNFILAFLLALIVVGYSGWDFATVTGVSKDLPAKEAGLLEGDIIKSVDGHSIWCQRDLSITMSYESIYNEASSDGDNKTYDEVTLVVDRKGEEKTIKVTPVTTSDYHFSGVEFEENDYRILKSVEKEGCFAAVGMQAGDKITKLNGNILNNSDDFVKYYNETTFSESVDISYERNGKITDTTMKLTEVETRPMMGFSYNAAREKLSALNVIKYSCVDVGYWIKLAVKSLGWLFTGKVSKDDMSGVVGIVDFIGDSYEETKSEGFAVTLVNLMFITILLSANVGVMNLIPFPALDGGRFAFLIVEAITKKKVKQEIEGVINLVGFVLLMLLMVFVTYNDVIRIIKK